MFVPVIICIGTSMLVANYVNFIESMLGIFILQSVHVATPSSPLSPMYILLLICSG